LGETGGLAAPIHLLNELQRIELRIGDEVAAGVTPNRRSRLSVAPAVDWSA